MEKTSKIQLISDYFSIFPNFHVSLYKKLLRTAKTSSLTCIKLFVISDQHCILHSAYSTANNWADRTTEQLSRQNVKVTIQLAKIKETMAAKYKYVKSYYLCNRECGLKKIESPAYMLPNLHSDLIGYKNLMEKGFRLVLDRSPVMMVKPVVFLCKGAKQNLPK